MTVPANYGTEYNIFLMKIILNMICIIFQLSHQLLDKKNQQINNNNNQPCVGDIVSGSSVGIIGAPPSLPTAPLIPAPPPTHRQVLLFIPALT